MRIVRIGHGRERTHTMISLHGAHYIRIGKLPIVSQGLLIGVTGDARMVHMG